MAQRSSRAASRELMVVVVMTVVASWLALMGSGGVEAAVSCGTVTGDLSQCLTFVTTPGAATPSASCCSGVKSLYAATRSLKADRVTACGCIKKLVSSLGSKLQPSSISSLPGKCGVNLGYAISTSTNCNAIP